MGIIILSTSLLLAHNKCYETIGHYSQPQLCAQNYEWDKNKLNNTWLHCRVTWLVHLDGIALRQVLLPREGSVTSCMGAESLAA